MHSVQNTTNASPTFVWPVGPPNLYLTFTCGEGDHKSGHPALRPLWGPLLWGLFSAEHTERIGLLKSAKGAYTRRYYVNMTSETQDVWTY